jgi:hypothetical protein
VSLTMDHLDGLRRVDHPSDDRWIRPDLDEDCD